MVYDVFIYIISLIDTISCEVESILLSLFYFCLQETEVHPTKEVKNLGSTTSAGTKPIPAVTQVPRDFLGALLPLLFTPQSSVLRLALRGQASISGKKERKLRKARRKGEAMGPSSHVLTGHQRGDRHQRKWLWGGSS